MKSRALFAVTLYLVFVACSSPTAPTPDPVPVPPLVAVESPVVATVPQPEPAPGPVAPGPAPTPTPRPHAEMVLDATLLGGHWYDPAHALPATFIVEVWPDAVWLGETRLARADLPEHLGILARNETATFTLQRDQVGWTWTFNGLAGQASGTAVAR